MQFGNADMTAAATTLRSRLSLQDAVIFLAALCAATLFALEYDFFENADHMTSRERRITVAEFYALTGLLIIGLIVFSFRRLQQQKREFLRRLAAEGAAREARHQAMRDPLTGLPNRRALLEAMSATLVDDPNDADLHALLLLDLNGFKHINDQFGHPIGDRLLETIARRMESIAKDDNLVARLGGDEFAVFCRSIAHADDAQRLAERLVSAIEAPIDIAGTLHHVGAGAGIALYPQHGRTERELLQCADVALYRAKTEKQSSVRCYH